MTRVKCRTPEGLTKWVEYTPLKPKRALQVADQLQGPFADVVVHGHGPEITVIAREHTGKISKNIRCPHKVVLRAKNVTCRMKEGFLVGSHPSDPVRRFAWVDFCQACDHVLAYESARRQT